MRRHGRRPGLAAAVAVLLLVRPAAAKDDGPPPTQADRGLFEACLASPSQEGLAGCIGKTFDACMEDGARPGHIRYCAQVETALWDEKLNVWYRKAMKGLEPATAAQLKDVQKQWIAWREGKCGFYLKWQQPPMALDYYRECLMRETAERAIELSDFADE